jgi:hypothetical protein
MEQKPSTENWDDFAGEYIKAEFIKEFPAKFIVVDIETNFDGDKPKLIAVVEYNEREFKFDLNKTNQAVIRKVCSSPKAIVGKILTIEKIKQRNPSTNALVDSLLIEKVE